MSSLDAFSPAAARWFSDALGPPTEIQRRGWPEIASGGHTLLCAPTGSGKTLAAFLWFLDHLGQAEVPPEAERCRVLYVSPLKALTLDVERNLAAPLRGLQLAAERAGRPVTPLRTAIRSGDTAAAERRDIVRHPPDILITTPESLYLLLTSAAREILRPVRAVIVDEIHAVAATKRGAHLALSLERLSGIASTDPQRVGLSATQRPLDEIGRFLGGSDRAVTVVDAGVRKPLELSVEVPVEDMADLDRGAPGGEGETPRSPRHSIWPAIAPRLLELIRGHRSTIVFVNSRRLSERLAAQINDLAGETLVRAHHGSIAREQRVHVEELLKAGALPALVATSSLELGIDMGAVDLVVQVGSPRTVAAGLQRVGRAGHSVGATSRGTLFPTHRGELAETAAITEGMLAGAIEETRVPQNPLDVLAQQVVAMCAMDSWDVDALFRIVTRAHPFGRLGRRSFEATLDMLDGRYPSEDFGELRPRIVWDRVAGTVRGRAGAQRLAVTSGGTIPDRGLYAVTIFDDGRRVGELDEEMVYELRPGEVFLLGASAWRCVEITPQQVRVSPAPGEPGKVAFWHGDAPGRPYEVGLAVGALLRELGEVSEAAARRRLRDGSCLDQRAVTNLLAHLGDQASATGAVPDDRTIVVERFRDQLGDWRVCVLTPFGAPVHAPWALVVSQRVRQLVGSDVQAIHSDDGFALRIADVDQLPPASALFLDPDEVTAAVTEQLEGSALFASRFRENAARALLLPRRRPGERTPLWQQRQRSASLLQVVSRHPSFPLLAETYRECLRDVFDLAGLTEVMRALRSRQLRVVEVETAAPSPVATSLLFAYVAEYMYDGDAPLAERRAAALTLDRELLADLLGSDDLRELLDAQIIAATELELQQLSRSRAPRDADEGLDVLRRLGDLSPAEAEARGVRPPMLAELVSQRRALEVRLAGESRVIATDDAARYRDALGVVLPAGLPGGQPPAAGEPLLALLRRYARRHVPFTAAAPAERWSVATATIEAALEKLVRDGDLVAGHFGPGGLREVCHPEVLQLLRRRSLAALRSEVEAVPRQTLGRFLPSWHRLGSRAGGAERLLDIVASLQALPLPLSVLERDVLPGRMRYDGRLLDELIAAGEVIWQGRGALGRDDARVALFLRGEAAPLVAPPDAPPRSALHDALRERLGGGGACFVRDLLDACPGVPLEEVVDALYDLVWSGEVTNDSLAPLRFLGPARRHPRRPLMRLVPPRAQGRWSLLPRPEAGEGTVRALALAEVLLARYGVLTREAVVGEQVSGGFAALYPVLRAMEEAGRIRRGYFVEGLGAAQFAVAGAVDALRSHREEDHPGAPALLLSALDPASPFGSVVPWPLLRGRAARTAGSHVVLRDGRLRLYLERGGRSLLTHDDPGGADVAALAQVAERAGRLEILTVDGEAVGSHPLARLLREGGFSASPRGLVLYPHRPGAGAGAAGVSPRGGPSG